MAVAAALLFLLLVSPAAYATDYIVGGNNGWNQGVDYTTWAQGKTFNVGDNLVFTYGSNHKVDVVNESDYNNCASSNAISTHSDGNTTIALTQAGNMYFICPTAGHCTSGMKLSVTVGSGSSGGSPTTSPPSGTTPSTDSSGAAVVSGSVLGLVVVLGCGLVTMG